MIALQRPTLWDPGAEQLNWRKWSGNSDRASSNPPTELQHLSHPVVLDCRLLNTEWSNPFLLVTFPPTARSQRSSHITRSNERSASVSSQCSNRFTLFRSTIVNVFKAFSCWNFLSIEVYLSQYLKTPVCLSLLPSFSLFIFITTFSPLRASTETIWFDSHIAKVTLYLPHLTWLLWSYGKNHPYWPSYTLECI